MFRKQLLSRSNVLALCLVLSVLLHRGEYSESDYNEAQDGHDDEEIQTSLEGTFKSMDMNSDGEVQR